MSVTKIVVIVSSLVLALMIGGSIFMIMNFNSLAKNAVERIASETLGVEVQVMQFTMSLKEQKIDIKGLKIFNPPGFKSDHAMTVGNINITLEGMSEGLVHFKTISVIDTDVNLEVIKSGTNLSVIKNQMRLKPKPMDANEVGERTKIIVNRLEIKQVQLNPKVLVLGEQDLAAVPIPDIILINIGKGSNGILARQAIMQVWNGISTSVNKSASNSGFYKGVSQESLKKMGMGQVQNFKKQIKEDVKGFGSSIRGMF